MKPMNQQQYKLTKPIRRLGRLIFGIKYRLGIAKEGKDFITLPEEFRCCICESQHDCPAYETGVIYPCPYFKEDIKWMSI